MNSSVLIFLFGVLGFLSYTFFTVIMYTNRRRTLSLLKLQVEKETESLLAEVEHIGQVELEQTQAGRELLEWRETILASRKSIAETTVAKNIALLRQVQPFSSLRQEDLRLLAPVIQIREYAPAQEIFLEGDRGNDLYCILEGHVLIYKRGEQGKRFGVRLFSASEFFGEMALLDDQPRSATAQAMTSTKVIMLNRSSFLDVVAKAPMVSLPMMRILSLRMRDFTDYSQVLAGRHGEDYNRIIAQQLLGLASRRGIATREGKALRMNIDLPLIEDLLMSMSSTEREIVKQVLSNLRDQGLVDIDDKENTLTVRDFAALFLRSAQGGNTA
jgi:CRP/FNR family transcriptional regulator